MNFKSCWKISGTHPLWVGESTSGIHGHAVDFEQAQPAAQLLWPNPTVWLQNITNFISFWIFINNWSLCIFPWKILEKILEKISLIFLSLSLSSPSSFFTSPSPVLTANHPTDIHYFFSIFPYFFTANFSNFHQILVHLRSFSYSLIIFICWISFQIANKSGFHIFMIIHETAFFNKN